jgi:hypothetical protein
MKVAVVVLAVQACSFFVMAEARAADDVYLFGGGGENLAVRTDKEASSLYYERQCFQRLCGRRKQKLVFTQRYLFIYTSPHETGTRTTHNAHCHSVFLLQLD